jgi:putative DNA primase/helicase
MSSLGEQFGLEPLITKPLAIISDARIGARTDKSAIVERLLSISGEDALSVPRKFNQAWEGQLKTRFMLLTNELPSLSDGSGALAGRYVVLLLVKSFFGKEDPALTNKLLTELSGILNWAIDGYRRLRKRGYFVMPKSSVEAVAQIEMLGAPVKAFIEVCCKVGPGLTVTVNDLWNAFELHSHGEGRRDYGSKEWFGRNLRAAEPGITSKRLGSKGKREPTYIGIALNKTGKENQGNLFAQAGLEASKR